MGEDVYHRLRDFLDTLPVGYPQTPDGVEIRILKKLFTPEQAALVPRLKAVPESVEDIAKRLGQSHDALAVKLEQLALDGLIFRTLVDGKPFYQAIQFVIGIYEFQMNRMDREFCEMIEAYLPRIMQAHPFMAADQFRILPVEKALSGQSQVATYNQIRELIKDDDVIAVAPCVCRKEQELLENLCAKPMETCLTFGSFSRFYIANNLARRICRDEALQILKRAEQNAMVLHGSNTQKLEYICCCCSCHCPVLINIARLPNPRDYFTTCYQSFIDRDLCAGCGACSDICPMRAVREDGGASQIIAERCIGCGLCAAHCASGAIQLIERKDHQGLPPADLGGLYARMALKRSGGA